MDSDRQNLIAARRIEAIETRAHRAHDDRADDFKMRRVERQRQMHQAAFGFDVGREAHMVLHVAGAEMIFMLAGELVEEILRLFAQHVDQHVQATAVRHTQHHFARAALAGVTDHFAQHRDQRVAALKREAFRAREFRAEVFFQPLCRGQLFQETFFLFAAKSCAARHRLQTLLDPALLFGVVDVHVLCTD